MNAETVYFGIEIGYLFLLHIIGCAVISYVALQFLRERFPASKQSAFLFVFLFNLAIPILGYFFSLWIAYYLKNVRYKETLSDVHFVNLDEFSTHFIDVERAFGEGSMYELLQNDYVSTSLKIKAIVSMSDNLSQKNISIIKHTLSSNNDEVRLFSFAVIDKIERGINQKIHKNLGKFKTHVNPKKKAAIAKELASLYWEMIYYELSEDSLRDYLLEEVVKYVLIAKKEFPYDLKLNVMLGRVYMLLQEYEKAATEFTYIMEMNLDENAFVGPYLAEINFNAGNYKTVQSIMSHISGLHLNSTLHPIVQQWRAV